MADEIHDAEVVEDAPPEQRIPPEVAARRAAALAHVRKFGDPVLRSKARRIEVFDDALRAEVSRMAALMHDSMGIGLAATQLGTLHRVLVYRVEHSSPVNALINPELEGSGIEARVIQHEMDHLDGVLIIDRAPRDQRKEAMRTLREQAEAAA